MATSQQTRRRRRVIFHRASARAMYDTPILDALSANRDAWAAELAPYR